MTPDEVSERLLQFAVRAGKTMEALDATRLGRHVAGQLVRSATSPLPNDAEACAAESRADFIHKLSICHKELRESSVWIRLIQEAGLLPGGQADWLADECGQLCRIIAQSLITARRHKVPGKLSESRREFEI